MNWRNAFAQLVGNDESPRRTAAAFALGVFLSFSPFIGLQIVTGMAIAFACRLNRAAVFVGLCMNLPWFIVPWYTAMTLAGAFLLDQPIGADFGARLSALLELPFYRMAFWERAYGLVAPFLWSFVVGSTIGAATVGGLTYVVTARLLIRRRLASQAQ